MAAELRLALHATLPDRYASHEVLASTVDFRGRLVALVADGPVSYGDRYDATAVVCGRNGFHEIPVPGLDLWITRIDSLGDGVVLAASRTGPAGVPHDRRGEPVPEDELTLTDNLRVIGGDGETLAAFYVGDAVCHLLTDHAGGIWTGYSDESNFWFANGDGTRSYGFMIGLARWDADGGPPWTASGADGVVWCDCYALNVGRRLVHACPYPDFPLVELDARGVRAVTPNPVRRGAGLAVSERELAFLDQERAGGGYRWRIRHARREGGTITETGMSTLLLPDGSRPGGWARGRVGRDGRLFLYVDGDPRHWYRFEVSA